MRPDEYKRFERLTFDDFRRMAVDASLSRHEKVGFPNAYREGKEEPIFADIIGKLPGLSARGKTVLEVGPGCSRLPLLLIEHCRRHGHTLLLVDSEEMLAHLPEAPFVTKIPAYYPHCDEVLAAHREGVDVILCYSVLHYVFVESNIWAFLDRSLELLAHGGEMLLGDIPNVSKRRRFFSSPAGVAFHREFTGSQSVPSVVFNEIAHHLIDDAVVLGLLGRARAQGFDAYVLPQGEGLPMANRREDLLIRRP